MAINSHIQLPNSILKYFRDESDSEKKVWYLDISSGSIMKAASNKIGTSKGYYSDFGENFWNRTVEDTLAKLNHKFYKIYMQKENAEIGSLPMSQDDKDIIKKYIKAAMVRSRRWQIGLSVRQQCLSVSTRRSADLDQKFFHSRCNKSSFPCITRMTGDGSLCSVC